MTPPVLAAIEVGKAFPGVIALSGVSAEVRAGEVLAVVGENGAGKSTLMKVLAGVYQPDSGRLELDGKPAAFPSARAALAAGVVLIHQELNLAENLSVAENLFLGRELTSAGPLALLDRRPMLDAGAGMLARVGLPADLLGVRAGLLSPGQKQLVEIARALGQKARVLIMDEPTSSLTQTETDRLYVVIDTLRDAGVAVVYISHRLAEVTRSADRAVVLRDGKNSGTLSRGELSAANLVRLMVGRELKSLFPRTRRDAAAGGPKPVRLKLEGVRYAGDRGHPIDLELRGGEVFGLGGLVGAGRTELAEAVFGLRPLTGGAVSVDGVPADIATVRDAVRAGLALAPEDRRLHGLHLTASVGRNLSLPNLGRLGRLFGWVDATQERQLHAESIRRLAVKTPSANQAVGLLSGGNQQKVVFGKWLARNPKVLILDEPTRGVDVGAKAEIYAIIDELCAAGVAVWVISSDLEELLGVSDRIGVLHEGRLAGILDRGEATEERVMALATGVATSTGHSA